MGAYVMKTLFQTSCISSGMFITAMAANPLAVDLARDSLGATIRHAQARHGRRVSTLGYHVCHLHVKFQQAGGNTQRSIVFVRVRARLDARFHCKFAHQAAAGCRSWRHWALAGFLPRARFPRCGAGSGP